VPLAGAGPTAGLGCDTGISETTGAGSLTDGVVVEGWLAVTDMLSRNSCAVHNSRVGYAPALSNKFVPSCTLRMGILAVNS